MNSRDLKEIIVEGESTILEFKRKTPSSHKIAKEISALANTKGGLILIGVDDDGSLVGISSEKSEIDKVEQAAGFYIDPPVPLDIEVVDMGTFDILAVHIIDSPEKPHHVKKDKNGDKLDKPDVYIRMGEKSVHASTEMIRFLRAQRDNKPVRIVIGDKEKRLFNYLEKHERATVKDFATIANISRRRAERLMIRLVRAGVLLIHNDEVRDYFTLK